MGAYTNNNGYQIVGYADGDSTYKVNYSPKKSVIGCTCMGMGCKGTCRMYA